MGHPALELQAAGFEIGLLDDGRVLVKPKSRLTDEIRHFIKTHKQELVAYLHRQAANDQANTDTTAPAVDWHQADRAYQAHHATCPPCRATGLGHGQVRCDAGAALWATYQAAPMPEFGKAKRVQTPSPAPAPAPQTPPRMAPSSAIEIVRMLKLHSRALAVGLPDSKGTDKAIDAVMDAPNGMACCFACSHLRGAEPERWRCAGAGHELSGLPLARAFVVQLHRCPSHQPPPGGAAP